MMKFVVTGGAGFIGSNLVDELVGRGHEVVVIDDLSTGNIDNLDQSIDKIRFVEGSILDMELLKREFLGADFVIHLAAIPSVPRSIDDPVLTSQVNVSGTLNVLTAAKETNIKRVVYSASSSRYGNSTESVKSEDLPTNPLSPYALQKLTAEEYCRLFYDLYGLETVACIFFNVFGPRQDPNSPYSAVIPKFVSQMMAGESPIIYGDGETSRDFTYVDNNVEALISACTALDVAGQSINIACGQSETLNGLIGLISQNLNSSIQPIFENFRPGDVKHSLASIDKARDLLDYEPKVSVAEGVAKYIDWYKNNNNDDEDYRIGFIGQGWIGKNYADEFENRGFEVVRYALEEPYIHNREKIKDCDIVFIAVPTPTTPTGFDDSIVRSAVGLVGPGKIAVIKSTILPGTTESIQAENEAIYVFHSPEFLTERTAAYDVANPGRNLIGIPVDSAVYRGKAQEVIDVLSTASISKIMTAREAELFKYIRNCFFYTKVVFMNMAYDLVEKNNGSWESIREIMGIDPWIGNMHIDPVHKSGRGAGGHCFIKDFAAFSAMYKEVMADDMAGQELLEKFQVKNNNLLIDSQKDLDLLTGVYGNDIL